MKSAIIAPQIYYFRTQEIRPTFSWMKAKEIAEKTKVKAFPVNIVKFPSGEFKITLPFSVRYKRVYLFYYAYGDFLPPEAETYLIHIADTVRQVGAREIHVFIPYLIHSRQERRESREGIALATFLRMLATAGVTKIYSFDIHASATVGFEGGGFVDNIRTAGRLMGKILEITGENQNYLLLAPDVGASKKIEIFAKQLHLPYTFVSKTRCPHTGEIKQIIPEFPAVDGIFVIDDIIDSAGTVYKLFQSLRDRLEGKDNYILATHAIFSHPANDRLQALYDSGLIKRVITFDTIPQKPATWHEVLEINDFVVDIIRSIEEQRPLEPIYREHVLPFSR